MLEELTRTFLTENTLLRGMILGFLLAAPVGPIGLLCIRRTLARGVRIGFATGVGAASADTLYGAIAAFGVTFLIATLTEYSNLIKLIGGGFLILTAYTTWHAKLSPPEEKMDAPDAPSLTGRIIKAYTTSFGLTLTNPLTLIAVLAVVATLGGQLDRLNASVFVMGVFMGSCLWWSFLVGGVTLIRHKFTPRLIIKLNHMTAIALLLLGIYALGLGAYKILHTPTEPVILPTAMPAAIPAESPTADTPHP